MSKKSFFEGNSISSSQVQDMYLLYDLLQPCRIKAGVIKLVQETVQTVASSEYIGDDVKKLSGCFIMCKESYKNTHREKS